MNTSDSSADSNSAISKDLNYIQCPRCDELSFMVVMDLEGDVVRFECSKCGGRGWEFGMEAKP